MRSRRAVSKWAVLVIAAVVAVALIYVIYLVYPSIAVQVFGPA